MSISTRKTVYTALFACAAMGLYALESTAAAYPHTRGEARSGKYNHSHNLLFPWQKRSLCTAYASHSYDGTFVWSYDDACIQCSGRAFELCCAVRFIKASR